MSKELWANWPQIRSELYSKKKRLLLLDFDGTLVPIAKSPDAVSLSKTMRKLLRILSHHSRYHVAVLSGRSLNNIRSFFRIKGITYVGNHGLQMDGGQWVLPPPLKRAKKLKPVMRLLVKNLRSTFEDLSGVFIEDKVLTISVHFRKVSPNQSRVFHSRLRGFKKNSRHFPIVWRKGKKVWEVRPDVQWGKGDAAICLQKRYPRAFPIVLGDDRTDEDMFKVLRNQGLTIRIGSSKNTAAKYYLKSQPSVAMFLEKLCE